MRHLRIAAAIVAVYAAVVLLNALLYTWSSGDSSSLLRAVIRSAGSLAVAHGLWRAARWAWWVAVVASGFLAVVGASMLVLAWQGGFEGRAHPALDVAFFAVMTPALAATFVLLLLRPARAAVRAARPPA